MARTFFIFIVFIAVFAGLCFLQVRLSKKPEWTAGLKLPCAHILLTVLTMCVYLFFIMIGIIAAGKSTDIEVDFGDYGDKYIVTVYENDVVKVVYADTGEKVTNMFRDSTGLYDSEAKVRIMNGEKIYDIVRSLSEEDTDTSNDSVVNFSALFFTFALFNIPTIVYLIIYFVVRQGKRNVDQLDKIEIQNL